MASSAVDTDCVREKMCSNQSRRVRIIGKIRAFTDQESESLSQDTQPWVALCKPQEGASSGDRVRVSFLDQSSSRKDASYDLDCCYEQDEDIRMIFMREIQPLISDIFCGKSASVIAYGARGSGKTYTIQGTEKNPGLAVMALTELLPKAEETEKSVSLSLCEVSQEHVYDLLDPNHSEVQVLEDAQGKINLKGLSQVSVKSILEFQNKYFGSANFGKSAQKIPLEQQPKRSHKVLIINVSDNSNCKLVGKMNFVDLAGYVDTRRTSTDGSTLIESTRINKSLHAVLNVIYALNTNESHVPYRESKLTRMLKESLGGRNHVLMLTCLNPLFCQDTIHMVSLASRSCQTINHAPTDSITKAKGSARPQVLSSQKTVKPATTPALVKKQVAHSLQLSAKKGSAMSKGRELFDNGKKVISTQEKCTKDADPVKMLEFPHEFDSDLAVAESKPKEVSPNPDSLLALVPSNKVVFEDKSIVNCSLDEGHEKVVPPNNTSNISEVSPLVALSENDGGTGKEDICLQKIDGASPPLSERLREISNNLKLFCSATPLRTKMPEAIDKQHSAGMGLFCSAIPLNSNVLEVVDKQNSASMGYTDAIEPRTPTAENRTRFDEKLEITKYSSPWETFNQRSSGMKNYLVEDYLKFLNTASKEELKRLKGIGEKRATYILELREESPEPFKKLEDLEDIGLSAKQIKGMMKKVAGELFS